MADDFKSRMQKLRETVPQAYGGGASAGTPVGVSWGEPEPTIKAPPPKPAFELRSVHPNRGFALIDTQRAFGMPATAPGMRKIQVGDELPEGSVTAITPEGIRVIPPEEGDEFVIPFGKREGYQPRKSHKTKQPSYLALRNKFKELALLRSMGPEDRYPADEDASDALVTPDILTDYEASPDDIGPVTVNQQGAEINPKVVDDHGLEAAQDPDVIIAVAARHSAENQYAGVDEEHLPRAAAQDYDYLQSQGREEVWSGDGPGGRGELVFYDGEPPTGYHIDDDGSVTNVTGILYPPTDAR